LRVAAALLTLAVATGCEVTVDPDSGTGSTTGSTRATDPADARAKLDKLTVVTRTGSMRGYSREKFPHWRDTGSNCDVRDTVLKRDGTKVKVSGCNVVAGTWTSVYDGDRITDPAKVDIDHVVPLANAWRSGASAWTTEKRADFANEAEPFQLCCRNKSLDFTYSCAPGFRGNRVCCHTIVVPGSAAGQTVKILLADVWPLSALPPSTGLQII